MLKIHIQGTNLTELLSCESLQLYLLQIWVGYRFLKVIKSRTIISESVHKTIGNQHGQMKVFFSKFLLHTKIQVIHFLVSCRLATNSHTVHQYPLLKPPVSISDGND